MRDGFFVKTDEKWEKVRYDESLWVRAFENGFEGNCYYIGKNPLYATGDYRQRMEGVFIKAKQQ